MPAHPQRPLGVTIPQGQRNERSDLPPLTIISAVELKHYAVLYVDETGRKRQALVAQAGDGYYMAPNGEQWLMQLRPLSDRMVENLKPILVKVMGMHQDEQLPVSDNVDVLARETATQ